MNSNEYNRFLKNLFDILQKEDVITKKVSSSKEKINVLNNYFEKLDCVQTKAYEKDELDRIKALYYAKYVIKESDIPDNYWHFLEQKYLNEGHGHFDLVNPKNYQDEELRKGHINQIINEQKSSLDSWLNYLLSPDSRYLPMWAKVWAFQGMLKIGTLNETRDKYLTRRKDTIAPFIDIDSELLGKSVEYLKQHLNKEDFEDEEIKKLANTESFASIYGTLLLNKKAIKLNGNEGIWIKYKYKSEEDAKRLYESLQGYNTGWCTAASLETAIRQVCGSSSYSGGDFYVYYSKNENNEYKIPRIAIRMERENIGEIRGIAKGQNIESDMEIILQEKLKEFPDGQKYQKKVSDMEKLTNFYQKHNTTELTLEELKFLYEIDYKIEGFGYGMDPRIREIIARRNHIQDLNKIFSSITAVAGNLNLDFLTIAKGIKLPKEVGGNLNLSGITSAEGLELPETIGGNLILSSLTSAEGLKLPKIIGGQLNLESLSLKDLVNIDDNLKFDSIFVDNEYYIFSEFKKALNIERENLKQLKLSEKLTDIYQKHKAVELTVEELKFLYGIDNETEDFGYRKDPKINEIISERDNVQDLNKIFSYLTTLVGDLNLDYLTTVKGLKFPKTINGNLDLSSLESAEEIELPETIGGNLDLSRLATADGLKFPKIIGGNLYLSSLANAKGIELPETIGGNLDLDSLTSAEGLILPQKINGYINLSGLKDAKELVLPQEVNSLILSGLESAEGLVLPQKINGDLNLSSLESAEGLELPANIRGNLDLSNLINAKGLVLPKEVDSICLTHLTNFEGIIWPEKVNVLFLDSVYDIKALVNTNIIFNDDCEIYLGPKIYKGAKLNQLLRIKREKLGLLNKKEELNNLIETNTEGFKRGFASIYLIIPFIIILGIAIAFIILRS